MTASFAGVDSAYYVSLTTLKLFFMFISKVMMMIAIAEMSLFMFFMMTRFSLRITMLMRI